MRMRTISIEEARAGFGDLIDRARIAGEPTLITRYGRPAAVVVSVGWHEEAESALAAAAGANNVPSGGSDDR